MQTVVQGVDDDINLGIVDEGVVTRMGARDVTLAGGGLAPRCIAAGNSHQDCVVDQNNCLGIFAEHPAGAQDAAAEFVRLAHERKRNGGRALVKEIVLTSTARRCYGGTAMTQGVKWFYLVTLAVWVGSIVFFSFVVAPTVFKTLKPEDAAALIRRIFSKYYLIGIICAAASIVCLGLFLACRAD